MTQPIPDTLKSNTFDILNNAQQSVTASVNDITNGFLEPLDRFKDHPYWPGAIGLCYRTFVDEGREAAVAKVQELATLFEDVELDRAVNYPMGFRI